MAHGQGQGQLGMMYAMGQRPENAEKKRNRTTKVSGLRKAEPMRLPGFIIFTLSPHLESISDGAFNASMFLTKTLRLRSCDFEPDLLSDGYFDILASLAMPCICDELPALVLLHRFRFARRLLHFKDLRARSKIRRTLWKPLKAPSNACLMHQIETSHWKCFDSFWQDHRDSWPTKLGFGPSLVESSQVEMHRVA